MVQPFTAGKCLATCKRDNQLHTCRADEGIVYEIPKDELEYLWGILYLCGQSVKKHLRLWAVPTKSLLTLQYFAPEFHLCPSGWCELSQHHCWDISQATLVPEGTPGWVQSHLSWWHWNQSRHIVTTDNFSFVWIQQWGILKMEELISSLLLQMEDSTISKDLVETYQKRWLQGHKSSFFYKTETLAPMSSHVDIELKTKGIMEEEEKHVSWTILWIQSSLYWKAHTGKQCLEGIQPLTMSRINYWCIR